MSTGSTLVDALASHEKLVSFTFNAVELQVFCSQYIVCGQSRQIYWLQKRAGVGSKNRLSIGVISSWDYITVTRLNQSMASHFDPVNKSVDFRRVTLVLCRCYWIFPSDCIETTLSHLEKLVYTKVVCRKNRHGYSNLRKTIDISAVQLKPNCLVFCNDVFFIA